MGTAYAASSRIWFTLWNGIITEVYYPTVDHPQIRDLQFLITDGKTFFHEEKRDLKSKCERLSGHALGYRYTNVDAGGRYASSRKSSRIRTLPAFFNTFSLLAMKRLSRSCACTRCVHLIFKWVDGVTTVT